MDERLLFRALRVPDAIVIEENRRRAAVAKLAELIKEPLLLSYDTGRIDAWLAHFAALAKAGELDGVHGGLETVEKAAKRLASQGSPDGFGWDLSFRLTTASIEAVRDFVEAHPFRDEAGRYFA